MKKRLRKKQLLGEFRVMGFWFKFRVGNLTEESRDRLMGQLIGFAESHGMGIGGGLGGPTNQAEFYVTGYRSVRHQGRLVWKTRSCTELDRMLWTTWLHENEMVLDFTVSNLIDSWHGPSEE